MFVFTVNNSPAAAPLTAPVGSFNGAAPEGNHWDYVSIMLAVRCLLFAAVCARCAVTGKKKLHCFYCFFFLFCFCIYLHVDFVKDNQSQIEQMARFLSDAASTQPVRAP